MLENRPLHTFTIFFFFFNDTATTEIYTLSLHDALPISSSPCSRRTRRKRPGEPCCANNNGSRSICSIASTRSEEHTSELQSQSNLVCRLLLEKKKNTPPPRSPPLCHSRYRTLCARGTCR